MASARVDDDWPEKFPEKTEWEDVTFGNEDGETKTIQFPKKFMDDVRAVGGNMKALDRKFDARNKKAARVTRQVRGAQRAYNQWKLSVLVAAVEAFFGPRLAEHVAGDLKRRVAQVPFNVESNTLLLRLVSLVVGRPYPGMPEVEPMDED